MCVCYKGTVTVSIYISSILSCINAFDFETFMPMVINVNLEFTSKIIFMYRN